MIATIGGSGGAASFSPSCASASVTGGTDGSGVAVVARARPAHSATDGVTLIGHGADAPIPRRSAGDGGAGTTAVAYSGDASGAPSTAAVERVTPNAHELSRGGTSPNAADGVTTRVRGTNRVRGNSDGWPRLGWRYSQRSPSWTHPLMRILWPRRPPTVRPPS
jgi:hypothetical protein